ncbi:MAG: translocation/assembly module TamB domain-containing protein [Candidatus Aminicenantes bacterium]|jgi:hypothetical protein
MKLNRKIKSLIVLSVIVLFVLGAGVVVKNIFLQQVKKKTQDRFVYSHGHLKIFPPSIVFENARSVSSSPFFSARKVSVGISIKSLFSKEKPFHVFIENPVLRIDGSRKKTENQKQQPLKISLPFSLERGWIKGGEIDYLGSVSRIQLKEIKAVLNQRRDRFVLLLESGKAAFSSSSNPNPVEGRVSLFLQGQGGDITIRKLKISSPSGVFRAQGSLTEPLGLDFKLTSSFNFKSDLIARLLKLPFVWEGRASGRGKIVRKEGEIHLDADFTSRSIHLNGVDMGKVDGKVDFSQATGGTVDVNIQRDGLSSERLGIRFKDKKVQGTARGVHLDPVMNYLSLPWPVASGTWGTFSLEKKRLSVDTEFRGTLQDVAPDLFPFQGRVQVVWDGRKSVFFSIENLVSSFAEVGVEGRVYIGQNMDISIKGEVKDIKQARRFTSLILNKEFGIPEIRGAGETELRIIGDSTSPDVRGRFSLSPAGFNRFNVNTLIGEAEIIKDEFFGDFRFDDPSALGRVRISAGRSEFRAGIEVDRGKVEDIFPALRVSLPLEGEASGKFELRKDSEILELQGDFSSSQLKFLGQPLTRVQGKLGWKENSLTLSDLQCQFHEGWIQGSALLDFARREFDLDFAGEGIRLSSIEPSMKGTLSLDLKGEGGFGQDFCSGPFGIKSLSIEPFQETEAEGEARFGFTEEEIRVTLDGNFFPGENEFFVSLGIPLREKILSGEIRGFFTNLDLLLPWKGAEGRMNYLGELNGPFRSLGVKGGIDFQGSVLPFPKFAHALRDYSGLIFVEDETLTLRALQGKMGGGDVQGQGVVRLGKEGVETIDLKMEGKNLLISPLERTQVLAEGELNLIKDPGRFVLNGDFFIHRLSWQRELDERFIFYSTPYYKTKREPGFFENLSLNIRLRADDNAWMDNTLGRIRGRLDLTISGNARLPVVLGDIEAIEGHVNFQDRKFDILRGRVSFSNPLTIEPYLSFTGETYVKDYRVTFSLDGLLDKLNPEFSSSPPLPPEDVLALLALGESFQRTYHYGRSSSQGTASLVSFQLSEEAKKSADKLFHLDRFRIDPFVLGSSAEMTARLTLGKKISRNFFILYSTNLTTQREEITRIEWQLTKDMSVVSTRNEKGRISIDVKIHKRF